MIGSKPSDPNPTQRRRREHLWVLPLVLAGLVLAAAPLYGRVMESLLWMGQTVRALCGF